MAVPSTPSPAALAARDADWWRPAAAQASQSSCAVR